MSLAPAGPTLPVTVPEVDVCIPTGSRLEFSTVVCSGATGTAAMTVVVRLVPVNTTSYGPIAGSRGPRTNWPANGPVAIGWVAFITTPFFCALTVTSVSPVWT